MAGRIWEPAVLQVASGYSFAEIHTSFAWRGLNLEGLCHLIFRATLPYIGEKAQEREPACAIGAVFVPAHPRLGNLADER